MNASFSRVHIHTTLKRLFIIQYSRHISDSDEESDNEIEPAGSDDNNSEVEEVEMIEAEEEVEEEMNIEEDDEAVIDEADDLMIPGK